MRERLLEYGGHHRSPANEVCHFVGIPSIVAGAGTLLGAVPLFGVGRATVTLAEVVAAGIIVFYVVSARWLGVVTSVLLAGFVAFGRSLPLLAGVGLFLGGWAVQFVGHAAFEHRSPAFLRNLLHLLVGPAWLVERATGDRAPVETPH
ncbi:MAG TPA: Mpo1-like protein [Polyangiaceae bacterium]|nr:Mpo1-like protein [Polyangiaceae bacterium]